jgi:hypothetical protein
VIKIVSIMIALLVFVCPMRASAQSGTNDGGTVNIHILDYCDPVSFNAVLGDGACVRDTTPGLIIFNGFIAEATAEKSVGAWRFSPSPARVTENDKLMISNLGGELHTFTKVKNFGGGFVAALNQLTGLKRVAPECGTVVDGNIIPQPPGPDNLFIPAGGTAQHAASDETVRFQCCIHPWMRTTAHVHD